MPNFLLIPADPKEPVAEVQLRDFRAMAQAVGGDYIERVRVAVPGFNPLVPVSLGVDEEFLFKSAGNNPRASYLYRTHEHGNPIWGPVLIGVESWVEDGVDWIDADLAPLAAALEACWAGVDQRTRIRLGWDVPF